MANFKGFRQVFKSEFDAEQNKVGYLWFVRENADSEMGEIYFGSRLYGKCSADVDLSNYYNMGQVDALLANKLDESALDAYAKREELDVYAKKGELDVYAKRDELDEYVKSSELSNYALVSLVEEVMGLIGLTASEDTISLVLSESFEGAETVVAALELLAGKLAAHESAAEARIAEIESKFNGLAVDTNVKEGVTYVVLKSGEEIISEFDASQFIVDGMLDNAKLEGESLVLTFNTAAGKEDITVSLESLIKTYVFNEAQFKVEGANVSLNEDYIKGLIAAAESGMTVVEGDGITVNYGTDENGAVVTVSAKVDAAVEGNMLAVGANGLYAILTIEGNDIEG